MNRLFKGLALLAILYETGVWAQTCTTVPQVNSVINGDFEMGNVASGAGSFVTEQIYVYDPSNTATSVKMDNVLANPTANGPCAWASDGYYHIASYFGAFNCDGGSYNGHPFLTEADGRYDHTQGIGGTGKYLMIDTKNGTPASIYGLILWQQTVSIVSNSQYYFSAWFTNFTPNSTGANRADLRFVVEAFDAGNVSMGVTELGTQFSPAETSRQNNWEQVYRTWTSPAGAVTAKISIYNQSTGVTIGNDIAIDDISFSNGCQAVASAANPPSPFLGADQNLCAVNGNITLNSGVATNAPSREFSWYSVSGSTETALVTGSTTQNTYAISAPGTYRVCVYEPTGCAKSDYVTITETNSVNLGADQNLCQPNASTVSFTGTLTTTGATYSYNWLRNGSPIAGTTNSQSFINTTGTYTINAVHPSRAACNATDNVVITANNTMTTDIGPDFNLCASAAANFQQLYTSSLTGSALTYQWQKDGVNIAGQTLSSYTANTVGTYRLNITHPVAGCSIFDEAVVTNATTMTTDIGPDANLCTASNAVFTSSLTHGTFTYQWQRDGTNIPGATSATYSATIPGTYRLNITQATAGCSLFDQATVTNTNAVTANNANFCAPPATTVGLSVTGPGTFNWYDAASNGNVVATNTASFTTPSISTTTTYYVQDMTSSSGTSYAGTAFGGADNWPTFASSEDAIPEGIVLATLKNNVTITSADIYVQEWASISGLVVDIVNASNTVIGSSAAMSYNNGTGSPYQLTVPLNVTLPTIGNYKMIFRYATGSGVIRVESPTFPITEGTSTINITGSNDDGRNYFRNIQFSAGSNPCARVPVTAYHTGSCPLPLFENEKESAKNEEKLEMNAYPNPVHSLLTVELGTGITEANYKVSELSGKSVLEGAIYGSAHVIDVNNLAKGIYILEVKNSTKVSYTKIIKD